MMFENLYKKILGLLCKPTVYKRYEWNINYLNHDFSDIKTNNIDMRKCKTCGIFVHHHWFDYRYNTFDPERISGETYPTLILSCEEMQIKNLLE